MRIGPPDKMRRIIHLDMDAFYASVEVLDNPTLAGKPVIVGGGGNRGVVSAASYAARAFGVRSAMPWVTAQRLCPQGIFLPVRMSRYQEVSERIMAIFREYTPLVEPLSLDEAFLDVTASASLFGEAEAIAREIRGRVRKEIGLTVSAGVASSKLVAKIASDCQKPDGLTVVSPGGEREFLAPLPVAKLWGAGKNTCEALQLLGVHTIGDLSRLPHDLLERKFGTAAGRHLHASSLGIDTRPVEPEQATKSVGREDTYERDLIGLHEIRRELLDLAVRVARRLRRHELKGHTVTLKVKYFDFQQVTRSETLPLPTDDHRTVFKTLLRLLPKTEAGKKPLRLLGVSLSNLKEEGAPQQVSLFEQPGETTGKREKLNRAMDRIAEKFGADAIRPGTLAGMGGETSDPEVT